MSTDGININLDVIKKLEVKNNPSNSEKIIEQAYDSAVSAFDSLEETYNMDDKEGFNIGELGLAINDVFKGHEEASEFGNIRDALDLFDAKKIEPEELAAQIIYSYGILFPEEKEELPDVSEGKKLPDENGEVSEEVTVSQELPGVSEGEKVPGKNGEAPEDAPTLDEGKEMPANEETLNKEYQAYLERHGETGALSEAEYEQMLEKFEELEDVDLSDGYSLDEITTIANSIDKKLTQEIMDKYQVDGDLGYALYQVENTYKGSGLEKTASMMTPDVALEEAGVNPKKAKYLKTDDDGTYYFVTGKTPGAGATSRPAIINNFYGGVYKEKENPDGITLEEYNVMMALNGINVFDDKEREGYHVPSLANIYLYSKNDIRTLTNELNKQGLKLTTREGMNEIINNPDKYSLPKLGQGVKTSAEQIPEAKGQTSAGDSGKVSTEGSSGASSSGADIAVVSEEGASGKIAADGTYKNEKAPEDSVDPVLADNAVNTTIESVVEAVKAGNLPQSALEAAKNNENTAKLLANIVDGGKHSLRTVAQTLIASGLADSPLGKQVLETMSQGSNDFKSLFKSGLTQSIPEGVTPIAGDIMFRTTGAPCTVADVKQDDKGQNIYTVVWGGIPTGSKQEVVSGTLEQLGLAKDKYIPVGAENKKALDAKAALEAQKAEEARLAEEEQASQKAAAESEKQAILKEQEQAILKLELKSKATLIDVEQYMQDNGITELTKSVNNDVSPAQTMYLGVQLQDDGSVKYSCLHIDYEDGSYQTMVGNTLMSSNPPEEISNGIQQELKNLGIKLDDCLYATENGTTVAVSKETGVEFRFDEKGNIKSVTSTGYEKIKELDLFGSFRNTETQIPNQIRRAFPNITDEEFNSLICSYDKENGTLRVTYGDKTIQLQKDRIANWNLIQ